MAEFVMALKGKGTKLNNVVWRTRALSLSEAKNFFVKLKNLPEKEFDKMFVVTEIKK